MEIAVFYNKIKKAISGYKNKDELLQLTSKALDDYFDQIFLDDSQDAYQKMTCLTVAFEVFYRSLSDTSSLKKVLLDIRAERWKSHYGTPTITFLLTHQKQIEQFKESFKSGEKLLADKSPSKDILIADHVNQVMVISPDDIVIPMPEKEEKIGEFVKTHNPSGGFTTVPSDPVSQEFIKCAEETAKNGGKVLEIGAAFGAATLQALAKGATVFCNDIDELNLAVVRKRHMSESKKEKFLSGDSSQLVLVPGSFPEELRGLPKNYFDAILVCRVLHFLKGEKIESSLQLLSSLLKPQGKLFIVCETPYLKNWQKFIPVYQKRLSDGVEWPGEIETPAQYESSGRAGSLPSFVHWMTKEVLERSISKAKLDIGFLSYIDRRNQFPADLLLDGRESVGAVAIKR